MKEEIMAVLDAQQLTAKKCVPCEGGVPKFTERESKEQLAALGGEWKLGDDAKKISRRWKLKNFVQAMQLVNEAARIAEEDQHHPDLHVTGYRLVLIELTTHAIDGLSENDFILAAKLDAAAKQLGF